MRLTTKEKQLIRKLQGDLPLEPTPFAAIARALGWTEERLLHHLRAWKKNGIIRRIGAIVAHTKVGYRANAMTIWEVPRNRVAAVGRTIARFPAVSHCYERACPRGWRHNPACRGHAGRVFAMIHARTRAQCRTLARIIAKETGIKNYELLFTIKEFKKESPRYFR
jgi:DNA-binding Lrp family transcriptional regulator